MVNIISERQIITKKAAALQKKIEPGTPVTETDSSSRMGEVMAEADSYSIKIIKYIPSEIVALFVTLTGILKASEDIGKAFPWVIFFICLCITPVYLYKKLHVSKWTQVVISTFGFAVWVFALGGPFKELIWYNPVYGALLLPVYTFLIPLVDEKFELPEK